MIFQFHQRNVPKTRTHQTSIILPRMNKSWSVWNRFGSVTEVSLENSFTLLCQFSLPELKINRRHSLSTSSKLEGSTRSSSLSCLVSIDIDTVTLLESGGTTSTRLWWNSCTGTAYCRLNYSILNIISPFVSANNYNKTMTTSSFHYAPSI